MPISVASKPLLGLDDITWVDPTLILSSLALLALMPHWGDFFSTDLKLITFGSIALGLLTAFCALSGFLLHPTPQLYNALREPIRLWLNINWLLTTSWFVLRRPQLTGKIAVISIIFALCSGIYLQLVVFGVVPAPATVSAYMKIYFLRQIVWINGMPLPRMGGLFIEAPPFGLFMFSMFAVVFVLNKHGFRSRWIGFGCVVAAIGILLSMADQVLLGCFASLIVSQLSVGHRRSKAFLLSMLIGILFLGTLELRSISLKENNAGSDIATEINGSSIGERNFHLRYGLSLLGSTPVAAVLGIGPGRYGEYVVGTGDYPDTVTMQTSEAEVIVEWGVVGLSVWAILTSTLMIRIFKVNAMTGVGLFLGLIIADSFQANWKHESIFFAIAVLCYCKPHMSGDPDMDVTSTAPRALSTSRLATHEAH